MSADSLCLLSKAAESMHEAPSGSGLAALAAFAQSLNDRLTIQENQATDFHRLRALRDEQQKRFDERTARLDRREDTLEAREREIKQITMLMKCTIQLAESRITPAIQEIFRSDRKRTRDTVDEIDSAINTTNKRRKLMRGRTRGNANDTSV